MTLPLLPVPTKQPSPRKRRKRTLVSQSVRLLLLKKARHQRKPKMHPPLKVQLTPLSPKKQPRTRKPRVPRPSRPVGEDPVGEPSKTMLFVANLGFNIDDEALSALFTDAGINVVSARVVRRKFGPPRRSKGYGFVDVGSEEEQQKAIEAIQGKEVGGRAIAVKIAVNATKEEEADNAGPEADAPAS